MVSHCQHYCCSIPRLPIMVLNILERIWIGFICVLLVRTPSNCPHPSLPLKLMDMNLKLAAHGLCRCLDPFAIFKLCLSHVSSLCMVMYTLKTYSSGTMGRYSNSKVFAECPVLNTLDTGIWIC